MSILVWIIVGLVAGVLASMVMGGTGYGIIGDIIIGIVGAFVGGWLLRALGTGSPFGGLPEGTSGRFTGAWVRCFLCGRFGGGGGGGGEGGGGGGGGRGCGGGGGVGGGGGGGVWGGGGGRKSTAFFVGRAARAQRGSAMTLIAPQVSNAPCVGP